MAIDERDYYYEPKNFRRWAAPERANGRAGGFSWRVAVPFWLIVLGLGYWVFSGSVGFGKPLALPASAPLLINLQLGSPSSPLTIRTPAVAQKANYFVKLEEWSSKNLAATIFVRGGESVTTRIAPGTYRIRVASGESWFGQDALFGARTAVMTGKVALVFTATQGQIIDLTQVAAGNLPMDHGGNF